MSNSSLNFDLLVSVIAQTHVQFQKQAVKAVNMSLTIRNWMVGHYIVEFEQRGEDRAAYGEKLFKVLADRIAVKGLGETNLKISRQFYLKYPEFKLLIHEDPTKFLSGQIRQLSTDEFNKIDNQTLAISQSTTDELQNGEELNKSANYYRSILEKISFTHFAELIKIDDPTKRTFYELLILKTTPSVKELKRQIDTLAFERLGLSAKKELANEQLLRKITPQLPQDVIKNIYAFDFLGLKGDALIEEKDLETALLDHLQAFIQELGLGFCFEYRQKRILIGDEYFFVDLVFYHRILKCHVLVELKVEAFNHTNAGQLNTYLNYYKSEVMQPDDNPPVGILLVTHKNNSLVEYATAGMDKQLFVSKYLLQLPKKEELEAFIRHELEIWRREHEGDINEYETT